MSRVFVKQVPRLVRQHLPHVPSLGATAVVEALEDIAYLRTRDKSVEKFFTHCISRALALLPELRVAGVIRTLFAFKRARIEYESFLDDVSRFIVDECIPGKPFESFLAPCTVNDLLLLYKAFAVNDHFNNRLYKIIMELLEPQIIHMTNSDCCVFFQSHLKYISLVKSGIVIRDEKETTVNDILNYSLITKVTTLFLKKEKATPEDITIFMEWLAAGSEYYEFVKDISPSISSFCLRLADNPVIFNINHIHRVVQSVCAFQPYMAEEHHKSTTACIFKLLQEAERRSDVQDYEMALKTFYALDSIGFWNFELLQGIMYSITNNVESLEDLNNVQSIIRSRLESYTASKSIHEPEDTIYVIDKYPLSVQKTKLKELIARLNNCSANIKS